MTYKDIYSEMRERNRKKVFSEGVLIDPLIGNGEIDKRRGVGVFSFGRFVLNKNFDEIVEKAQSIFNSQITYLPDASSQGVLHHTFFQYIKVGGIPVTDISSKTLKQYDEILTTNLSKMGPYTIEYKGLIAVPSGVVLAGFPDVDINPCREAIRNEVVRRELAFDEPYKADTAHSTFLRLCGQVDNQQLVEFAEKYQNTIFGTLEVVNLKLMFGTWRMRHDEIEMIQSYQLHK